MSENEVAMPRQVGHVRDALKREFEGFIQLDDFTNRDPRERDRAFLSRGLAALFVRSLTGCDSPAAAGCVIDGRDDYGIDAVAVLDGAPRIWLIQAKWSDRGTAGFGMDDALKLRNGLWIIDQREYGRLNNRFAGLASQVNVVLDDPRARITLLPAIMGSGELSPEVRGCFEDAQNQFNTFDLTLDYDTRTAADALRIVRGDLAEPPITLTVKMHQWLHVSEPYKAYHGSVPTPEVAHWYEVYGDRLFAQNIRKYLGLTKANLGTVETLTEDPDVFWYYNNGITVLCDDIDAAPFSRSSSQTPVELRLADASVVNGAQTVAAIHEAMRRDAESAGRANVSVKGPYSKAPCLADHPNSFHICTGRPVNYG